MYLRSTFLSPNSERITSIHPVFEERERQSNLLRKQRASTKDQSLEMLGRESESEREIERESG